jgi:hypothetical protein
MSGTPVNAAQAPLPTRCVEVLGGGFQLKETASQVGSYIALSHRWMPETELSCTTADNIEMRKSGGDDWLRVLPKTFLDTLRLAERLGIRYIWIDSLCIIQHGDDGADWRRESIKMADYYQLAIFTVTATSGTSEHGLIPPRIVSPPRIARLPYRDISGSHKDFFYIYSYNREVDQQYNTLVLHSELLGRGWVFQEWLLSRRIVYFTPAGMFFECQERKPYNERGEVSEISSENGLPMAVPQLVKSSFLLEAASINSLWYQIVESYSAQSLTQPEKDRVIALAGISKEFREVLRRVSTGSSPATATVQCGLESVSGLWLRDLHRGLLWEHNISEYNPRRLPLLPTWSWTSLLCPVRWSDLPPLVQTKWRGIRLKPMAKFLAVTTSQGAAFSIESLRPTSVAPLTFLKEFDVDNHFVWLSMNCKALQVVVREKFDNEEDLKIVSKVTASGKSAIKTWRTVCSPSRPSEVTGWVSLEHSDYQDDSVFQEGLYIHAFLIATTSRVSGGFGLGYLGIWHDVFHILLVKNTDSRRYERIGVGRLFGKDIETQLYGATAQDVELI